MTQRGVYVDGLREMIRDLEKAGVAVEDLKEVFSAISTEAAEVAARNTPRRSGALAASIRGNKAKNKAVVTAGKARTPYAGPIFYGWPKRNIKASGTVQKTDAVMQAKAPEMLEEGISQIFDKYGF